MYRILLPLLTVLGVLVVVEAAARIGLSLGLLVQDPPMLTVLPPGTNDWRLAHITGDRYREPDPVLWWRPVAAPPYNRQGFKGREVAIPKPAGVVRVVAYGDSNTDGPPSGGWLERLQARLDEHAAASGIPYEVVNAGVAGYTSHQGLLRFREDVERLAPDVVLVSFGWNDVATVRDPDSAFTPPPGWLAAVQRKLLRLRSYRVARHQLRVGAEVAAGDLVARVSLDDYQANLRRFVALGRRHGAVVVLLTRPHRDPPAALAALAPTWLARVPEYNQALRRLGRELKTPVVDVQQAFEEREGAPAPADLFADECHFTPAGSEVMAELVAGHLRELGLNLSRDRRIGSAKRASPQAAAPPPAGWRRPLPAWRSG